MIDYVRKLRGIYFVDPEEVECKETMKKRAEKWRLVENPTTENQGMHAPTLPQGHEARIVGKVFNLGAQVHSCAPSDENPGCKSSGG